MKSALQLFVIFLAMSLLSSCGGGGKSVLEVKLIPVKSGKEFQYIDKEGKIVINPQFSEATIFRNGLALVKTSSDEPKWGFISEDGKFAITANYKSATVFSDDLAWVVSENAPPTAINSKGEIKVTLQDAETVKIFKEGLSAFSIIDSNGFKWGFVGKEGKVKINPQFSNTGNFSNGKCAVKNSDGKWGYIDKDGKILINYQFEKAKAFVDGKAIVVSGAKTGLIDETGKYLINPQFSDMIDDGGKYLIEQDRKWGWCDEEGKIIINAQFGKAFPFMGNDLAAVLSGKSWGYIDIAGKIVINPQFVGALPFNGKIALVVNGRKAGFIDEGGKYIINPQFDEVSKDLLSYLRSGSSEFESVETDFFNVAAIGSILNFDSPEGFTFNSTFMDVMKKYELKESKFSKYRKKLRVVSNKKITNDATYSFYVIGNAFDKVQVLKGSGWYTYTDTEYRFNGESKPTSYEYVISLSGRGYRKGEAVISDIQLKLSGFKKDDSRSDENTFVYTDGKKEVSLFEERDNVKIRIDRQISQNEAQASADNIVNPAKGRPAPE
jgi:hypothetical protein